MLRKSKNFYQLVKPIARARSINNFINGSRSLAT